MVGSGGRATFWKTHFFPLIKQIFFTLKEREKWRIKMRVRAHWNEEKTERKGTENHRETQGDPARRLQH